MKRLTQSRAKSLSIGMFQSINSNKLFITILLSLSWCHFSFTGLIQGDHFVIGEKHICLFGDHHEAGTTAVKTAEVENFVAAIKETSSQRSGPLTVLYEKHYARSCQKDGNKFLLSDLEAEVKKQDLGDVTLIDGEIRKVCISARNILEDPQGFITFPANAVNMTWKEIEEERMTLGEVKCSEDRTSYEDGPKLRQLTFQDIITSYTCWFSVVSSFAQKHKGDRSFGFFNQALFSSRDLYEDFISLMHLHQITPETNLVQFTVEQNKNEYKSVPKEGVAPLRIQLKDLIVTMSYGLLEAYLFQQIYEYSGHNIIVLTGASHTEQLRYMLEGIGASHEINYATLTTNEMTIRYLKGQSIGPNEIKILSKPQLIALLKGYSFSNSLWKSAEAILSRSVAFIVIDLGGSLCPRKSPEKE